MELVLDDLRLGYVTLVKEVARHGRPVVSRGLATRELTAVSLIFPNVLNPLLPVGVGRGVNVRLAAIEALQLISGIQRHDLVRAVTPGFDSVLVDQENPDYGAYGPRIIQQVGDCVDILAADPTTRRAVIAIWNELDLTHNGDRPCTVFLQFLVRDNGFGPALELHSYMRSQDVWLGVPYDIFMFSQLQHTIAFILGLPAGQLAHHVTSMHIYNTDLPKVDKLYEPTSLVDCVTTSGLELPLGIQCPKSGTLERHDIPDLQPLDVASYFLEDSMSDDERALNPWYDEIMSHVHRDVERVNTLTTLSPATSDAVSR